jgi:hypothetical protein
MNTYELADIEYRASAAGECEDDYDLCHADRARLLAEVRHLRIQLAAMTVVRDAAIGSLTERRP